MRFLTKFEHPIFQPPGAMVLLLVGANLVLFGVCFVQSGTQAIAPEVLLHYGAMTSAAIERHDYWRMIAYGFLHGSVAHLFANMFLLILWGGHLEKRLGSLYFAFIYVSGLLAGALVSRFTAADGYVLVGAAGALSAVFGALVYLRVLGKFDLPWEFFAISVGVAVALIAIHSRIDGGAQLRGFVAGMVCCGCLDLVEKVLGSLLRCRFPEFVKVNTFLAFAIAVVFGWPLLLAYFSLDQAWLLPLAIVIVALVTIKALDLMLAMRRGIAFVIIILALANAALVLLLRSNLAQGLASLCGGQFGGYASQMPFASVCANGDIAIGVTAIAVFIVTMLIYGRSLVRGISDVGFLGNTLRAERLRYPGL